MASVAVSSPFQDKLSAVLREDLRAAGIQAEVEVEPRPTTRLHRAYVISDQRDELEPSEWDELIWRIIRRHFGNDADLQISTFYTVTPEELASYRAQE